MATVAYHMVESGTALLHAVIAGQVVTACGRRGRDWQVVLGRHVRTGWVCQPCLRALQRAIKHGPGVEGGVGRAPELASHT